MRDIRKDPLWEELYNQILNLQKQPQGQATGGAAPLEGYVRYDRNPYEDIQNDKTLSTEEKVKRIKEISSARDKEINSEHFKKMGKLWGGTAVEIGSAAIPWGMSGKVAATGYKMAKPLISQIAKKELTKGAVEGMTSGAVSGLGRGMMEDKNPLQTAAQDAGTGLVMGAALGKLAGKIHENNPRIKDLDDVLDKRQDWGIAYRKQSGKPAEAIDKLLQEKQGFVPKAFNKEGIGDVDLVWGKGGKKGFGLSHVVDQRNAQNINGEKFIKLIPQITKEGSISTVPNQPNISFINNNDDAVLVKRVWDDKKRNWVVTAFKNNESPSKPTNRTPDIANNSGKMTPLPNLQGDNNIIPDKQSSLKSFEDWLKEVKRKRGHK